MRDLSRLVVLGLALPLVLVACGGDDSGATPTPDADLTVQARDIAFDKKDYELAAGSSTIAYVDKGTLVHTLVIRDASNNVVPGFRLQVSGGKGKVDSGTVDLAAGTYTFVCDIPGHEDAGMKATLTVK